jgi:hypothetical protein
MGCDGGEQERQCANNVDEALWERWLAAHWANCRRVSSAASEDVEKDCQLQGFFERGMGRGNYDGNSSFVNFTRKLVIHETIIRHVTCGVDDNSCGDCDL